MGIYNIFTFENIFFGYFGNLSYRDNNFLNAKKQYENILKKYSGSLLLKSDLLYNIGNTYYRLGEQQKDQEKIKLWQESIKNYTDSLSLRDDIQTEKNLIFVKNKLEEVIKKQEENTPSDTTNQNKNTEKVSENNKQQTGWWTEEKVGTGKQETDNKTLSWQNWSNGGSYNSIGWFNSIDTNLSPVDKKELEKYLKELKKFAQQNGKLLNPEKTDFGTNIAEQIQNFFWSDTLLQDIMSPNNKKDW